MKPSLRKPVLSLATSTKQNRLEPKPARVGELWHRVDGSHLGDEVYEGMELQWTTWRCVKTTPKGAWFQCVQWKYRKPRFALTDASRAISRTKQEALERLIARKVRHLRILHGEAVAAEDTLVAARTALAEFGQGAESEVGRQSTARSAVAR